MTVMELMQVLRNQPPTAQVTFCDGWGLVFVSQAVMNTEPTEPVVELVGGGR